MTELFGDTLHAAIAATAQTLTGRRIATLTGAGISTDSGIPAYRGVGGRNAAQPMTIDTFLGSDRARQRYWMGSHLGWRAFQSAEPNSGHLALAALESAGVVTGVVTQNVDGLHLRAGSGHVVEIHGTMRRVVCLDCKQVFDRRDVGARIESENPWIQHPDAVVLNPDGDVAIEQPHDFRVPQCTVCEGALKPDVVFFGEYVPTDRFAAAESLLKSSDALIVAGTSLVVNSGVRLIERARRRGIPLVIINLEPTRADPWAHHVLRASTGDVLPQLAEALL